LACWCSWFCPFPELQIRVIGSGGPAPQKKATSATEELLILKQQEELKEKLLNGRPANINVGTPEATAQADAVKSTPDDPAAQANHAERNTNAPLDFKGSLPGKNLAAPPDYAIPKSVFSEINEQGLHIRHGEAPAYWGVLATLRDLSQTDLEQAALQDITYSQVFSEPDAYRGKPMTVEGELLKLTSTPAGENPYGIETVYEGWFRNADSYKNPYVFHCLDKPTELPEGDKLSERIRITGYFFKRYQYAAKSGLPHAAPMLLAKRIRWYPAVQRPAADPSWVPYILLGLVVVGTTLAGAICWVILREQRRSNQQLKRFSAPTLSDFESVDAGRLD
jgi:hypothetical protein